MQRLLGAYPNNGVPHQPSEIARGIFLGTTADTSNARLIRRLGITHIINCSSPVRSMKMYGVGKLSAVEDGILGYMGLDIEDTDEYNISAHFKPVSKYMKQAREMGGKVLLVGTGVSPATTLVIAYLMMVKRQFLLETAQLVKNIRTVALTNINFMRQLVELAEQEELFDPKFKTKIPEFVRGIDKPRFYSAHLPDIYLISSRPYTLFKPNIKGHAEYETPGPFYRRSRRNH